MKSLPFYRAEPHRIGDYMGYPSPGLREGYSLVNLRTLSIEPKIPERSKQWYSTEISLEVSGKSEMWTIQTKIPGWKSNETAFLLGDFRKVEFSSWGCPLFRKLWIMLFHSPLKMLTRIFCWKESVLDHSETVFHSSKMIISWRTFARNTGSLILFFLN